MRGFFGKCKLPFLNGLSLCQDWQFNAANTQDVPLHVTLSNTGLFETEEAVRENFDVLVKFLKLRLKDKGYQLAEDALDLLLEEKKSVYRKDKNPAAIHELLQTIYALSCFEDSFEFDDEEGLIFVILCHDLKEDFGRTREYLFDHFQNKGHSSERLNPLLDEVDTISYHNGDSCNPNYKDKVEYSLVLRGHKIAGLAKLFDNVHNVVSALYGLSDKRVTEYVGHIHEQLDGYVEDLGANFPELKDVLSTLQKVIEQSSEVVASALDDHSDLTRVDEIEYPQRVFRLPKGLHPFDVVQERGNRKKYDRVQSKEVELAHII